MVAFWLTFLAMREDNILMYVVIKCDGQMLSDFLIRGDQERKKC